MAELVNPARTRIYVSYQAGHAEPASSRLLEDLRRHFGPETIVTSADVSATPSKILPHAIDEALESCHSLVFVIGDHWFPSSQDEGARRSRECIEAELSAGLSQEHIAVLPVLLDSATVPSGPDLPEAFAALAERQSFALSAADWDRGIEQVFAVLERAMRIAGLVEAALTALQSRRVDTAAACVQSARALDPEREDLARLIGVVDAAREERARRAAEEATRAVEDARRAAEESRQTAGETPPGCAPEHLVEIDENVQFTVFRRTSLQPDRWYPLLAFAHLSERRPDAAVDEPDPVAEVQNQAARLLGPDIAQFRSITQDSVSAVMREGELRFVPQMEGVEFNPAERRFFWTESVHREEFRMRADRSLDGRVARGTLTVYSGNLVLADVQLTIKVDRRTADAPQERSAARPYRRIFASYSHRDTSIVEEFESHATALGDRYLRDVVSLRAGEVWSERLMELIDQADVFQLFWSWNALSSPMVRAEWQHALGLNRPLFVRPVYWEDPFPEHQGLPPSELRRLHFQKVFPRMQSAAPVAAGAGAGTSTSAVPIIVRAPAAPPSAPEPIPADPFPTPPPWSGPVALPSPPRSPRGPDDTAVVALPMPQRSSPRRQSNLRVIRYAALAAVCVIAASVLVSLRPYLMSSPAPPVSGDAQLPSAAPPTSTPAAPDTHPSPPPPVPAAPSPRIEPPDTPAAGAQPPAPPSVVSTERSAITEVIRRYELAWSRMDRAALMQVWAMPAPAAAGIDAELGRAQLIDVRVQINSIDIPSDTRATVRAVEARSIKMRNSDVIRRTRGSRVFHLEKRGSKWIIVTIA